MRLLLFAGLLLLTACASDKSDKQEIPAGFVQRTFEFKQRPSLLGPKGRVTLLVPAKYDTLLVWLDASDTPGGDKAKYRFVNAKDCLLQESGFFKREGTYCSDSLDRLTIETQMNYGSEETLEAVDRRIRNSNERNKAMGNVATVWKSKKLATINGRLFSIVEFFGAGNLIAEPYQQIVATTTLQQADRSWEVRFQFDCKRKNCQDFAPNASTVIKSIQLDTMTNRNLPNAAPTK